MMLAPSFQITISGCGDKRTLMTSSATLAPIRESREVPVPAEPLQQHAGRRPGSRATTRNAPAVSEADPDSRPTMMMLIPVPTMMIVIPVLTLILLIKL